MEGRRGGRGRAREGGRACSTEYAWPDTSPVSSRNSCGLPSRKKEAEITAHRFLYPFSSLKTCTTRVVAVGPRAVREREHTGWKQRNKKARVNEEADGRTRGQ